MEKRVERSFLGLYELGHTILGQSKLQKRRLPGGSRIAQNSSL